MMTLKTMSSKSLFLFAMLLLCIVVSFDANASNVYDGTWSGTATSSNSEGGSISINVSSDYMTSFKLTSFVVKGTTCSTTTNLTATGSVSVSSGSFSVTFTSTYNTFAFSGSLSSSGSASGTWSAKSSTCNSSSSGTWTATKSGSTVTTTTTTAAAASSTTTTAAATTTTTAITGGNSTTTTSLTSTTTTTADSGTKTISYIIPYLQTNPNQVLYCMTSNMTSSTATGYVMILGNNASVKPTQSYESTPLTIDGKTTKMITFNGQTLTLGSTSVSLVSNTGGVSSESVMYGAKLSFSSSDNNTTCSTLGMACFQGTTNPKRNLLGVLCYDGSSYYSH